MRHGFTEVSDRCWGRIYLVTDISKPSIHVRFLRPWEAWRHEAVVSRCVPLTTCGSLPFLCPTTLTPSVSDLVFDIVYFFAGEGGGGDAGVIYDFLDWKRSPGKAVTMVAALLWFGIPLAHGLFVLIARARDALRRRYPNLGWQVGSVEA